MLVIYRAYGFCYRKQWLKKAKNLRLVEVKVRRGMYMKCELTHFGHKKTQSFGLGLNQ